MLAWISTGQNSPHTALTQMVDFPAILPHDRYPNWCSDRQLARCLLTTHCFDSLDFLTSTPKVTPRMGSISAPIRRIDPRDFASHLNHLSRPNVRGISSRGNPG